MVEPQTGRQPAGSTVLEKADPGLSHEFSHRARSRDIRDEVSHLPLASGEEKRVILASRERIVERCATGDGKSGGVYLGAPPYLFFLQDTKGTGKCDKYEILLSGFGSQDTHEIAWVQRIAAGSRAARVRTTGR